MKKLIKPVLAGILAITSVGVFAQGYTDEKVEDVIDSMDSGTDRKISFQEFFDGSFTDNNDSFDVNKDGYITSGEIVIEIKEDLVQTIQEMRRQGVSEKNINRTIANELRTAEREAAKLIKKMDLDKDGLVEPAEITLYQKKQFNTLDKNKDGVISRKDVKSKGWPIRQ